MPRLGSYATHVGVGIALIYVGVMTSHVLIYFSRPNDVLAVGPNQFYFTNYQYYHGNWKGQLELYQLCAWGSIGYYDGSKTVIIQDQLCLPNGINMSPDER